MRRREFIVGLAALGNVGRARAQDRLRRVGALITEPDNVLEAVLKQNGWVVGQNLQVE